MSKVTRAGGEGNVGEPQIANRSRNQEQSSKNPSFLLVHGAWQAGWVWDGVVAEMNERGLFAKAIDLPGSGTDTTPASEVSLAAYAEAIIASARTLPPGPVALVGHSMGGAAITAAAASDPELFDQLVYLCAFLPQRQQSVAELVAEGMEMTGGVGPEFEIAEEGRASRLLPASIRNSFLHDCEPGAAEQYAMRFTPQAMKPIVEPASWSTGFEAIPKGYIFCTKDRVLPVALQEKMASAAGAGAMYSLEAGHEPFLSCPGLVADALIALSSSFLG
ncbi:esterase [Caballeronia fortuita]|uniref:Esterase n=1 Tax=Caballeronia fortuita TaxID=1777138 RepID=A0A158CAR8_9BURK|nr:alpha/beta hydrolase [Caballeronia fortuita]SAK79380.1 esterase [Caballeronia fortuita]